LKKILIVDDSQVWRTYLQNLLEKHGHTTEVAKDGLEGLNRFFMFLPDIVIVDYVMPKLNGIHFTRFIRSFNAFKNVGILMLTGAEETINRFWAKKSGANAFLKKTETNLEIEKAILDFVNSDYSIEWSREIYKIHLEPFGELVDIVEESLRESTITKEILELTKLIYDEKLLMERLYHIFKELFDFDNVYICLSTYSEGRIYAFGNGKFADFEHVLDATQTLGYFTYYEHTEQKYLGESRTIDSFAAEILMKNDNPVGFVLVENPKIPEVVQRTLALSSYSLVQIFDLLNLYKILSSQKEIDEITGTYNCHVIQGKISNSIDFAMRNGLPLSFLRIKFNNLKDMYKTLGIVKTNQTLKMVLNTLSKILSTEIGRISMNEFIIILLGKTTEQVEAYIDKIKNEILANQNIKIIHSIIEWNGQTVNEILEEL